MWWRSIVLALGTGWLALGWLASCGPTTPPVQGELVILSPEASSEEATATTEASPSDEEPTVSNEPTTSEPASSEATPDASSGSEAGPEPSGPEASGPEPGPERTTGPEAGPEPGPEPRPEPPAPDRAPGNAWIGEACTQDSDCNVPNARCLRSQDGYPGGHCTQSCTSTCPDKTGKPVTFCIADKNQKGHCVSQCETDPCRSGYTCLLRSRVNDASKLKKVCVPASTTPGTSVTALYIGDSQSSGTNFAKLIVDYLRNPSNHCTNTKTKNNTVFSYAKVSSASRHWSELSGSSKNWLCGATKVYTNGTASSNTTGSKLCAGITSQSKSIFQKLVAQHQPTTFLVQLGGNSMGFSESYVKSRITRMLDQMPNGSTCFWVTPSFSSSKYMAQRRNVEKWTKETLKSYQRLTCHVLTSIDEVSRQTTCSSFNSSDGLHMTSCGSQLWGRIIIQKLCAIAQH